MGRRVKEINEESCLSIGGKMKTKYKLFRKGGIWNIVPPPPPGEKFELFWESDTKTAYIRLFSNKRKEKMEQISKKEYEESGSYCISENYIHKICKDEPIKKPSISSLKKKAWTLFSTYIRLRDCLKTTGTLTHGVCISCGKPVSFEDANAGHFMSRRWNETLFDEKNVNLQCVECNFGKQGNVHEYRRRIVEMYSEEDALELERRAWLPHKFTVQELQDLIQDIKTKILTLEEE